MAETVPVLRDGTVTAVRAQQHDPDRVAVFLDGTFAFGLTADLAVREGVRPGVRLDVPAQQRLLGEDEALRARRVALEAVARRAHTQHEVRRLLARRGFSEDAAARAVERLVELGYLDDAAFAHAYVSGRHATRGHGPERLRADLRRRGVAPDDIEAALAAHLAPDDLREVALRHGRRRWLRLAAEPDPWKRRRKLADFLARRGYEPDLIREVTETLEAEG